MPHHDEGTHLRLCCFTKRAEYSQQPNAVAWGNIFSSKLSANTKFQLWFIHSDYFEQWDMRRCETNSFLSANQQKKLSHIVGQLRTRLFCFHCKLQTCAASISIWYFHFLSAPSIMRRSSAKHRIFRKKLQIQNNIAQKPSVQHFRRNVQF